MARAYRPADARPRVEGRDPDADYRTPRRGPVSVLPNVVTLMALACGLSSTRYAIEGLPHIALLLIGAAAVLDGLDGRLARLLDAQSKMGEELDSLCDAVGFGVTPALVTYFTLIRPAGGQLGDWGWMAALVYAAAIVLRLARFNTLLADDSQPAFHREFFVGVPAPAAALLVLAPVITELKFGDGWWSHPVTVSVWLVGCAALAFSRVPTLSLKSVHVGQRLVPVLLGVAVVLFGLLVTQPLALVLVIDLIYLAHIPFAVRTYLWLRQTPAAWTVHGRDRRDIRKAHRGRRPRLRG